MDYFRSLPIGIQTRSKTRKLQLAKIPRMNFIEKVLKWQGDIFLMLLNGGALIHSNEDEIEEKLKRISDISKRNIKVNYLFQFTRQFEFVFLMNLFKYIKSLSCSISTKLTLLETFKEFFFYFPLQILAFYH